MFLVPLPARSVVTASSYDAPPSRAPLVPYRRRPRIVARVSRTPAACSYRRGAVARYCKVDAIGFCITAAAYVRDRCRKSSGGARACVKARAHYLWVLVCVFRGCGVYEVFAIGPRSRPLARGGSGCAPPRACTIGSGPLCVSFSVFSFRLRNHVRWAVACVPGHAVS